MPLYLTGGGDQEDFANLDRYFLGSIPQQTRLLVIPQALDDQDFDDALDRAASCFDHPSIIDFALATTTDNLTREYLREFQVVFIEGGNTFRLIEATRQSHFFPALQQFYREGGHIYADSAGAIILGADVKTAFLGDEADQDIAKIQDYRGLGLIDPWSIHCHYQWQEAEQLQDYLYQEGHPILALQEPSGVAIDGFDLRVFGKVDLEAFTFVGRKAVAVGDQVDLRELMEG